MTDIRYISTKEAAEILGLSTRRVVGLCNAGKLEGALRKGRSWMVPEETAYAYIGAEKPKAGNGEIFSCAVGNTSYMDVVKNSYYVDKTLLIRDLIDDQVPVILFTRPRRFGKTLALDMLKTFFEKTKEDTSIYFKDKQIWTCGEKHHQSKVVIIIDEYDTPIQQGHSRSFYNEVITFMRNFMSGGLKDNPSLAFGVLIGILCVSKENLFSGLNNPIVNSVLDEKYSKYFGFTVDEVNTMAAYYGQEAKLEELREWYEGYRFGSTEIYNPWSVANYFYNNCQAKPYWTNTSDNEIIREIMISLTPDIAENIFALLQVCPRDITSDQTGNPEREDSILCWSLRYILCRGLSWNSKR